MPRRERALRIGDLAEDAGVDPASLARAFRAHYGTSHFTRVFGAVHGLTPRRWRAPHGK